MAQKYNTFYIDKGARKFYDFIHGQKLIYMPDGWSVRADEWLDKKSNKSLPFLVFTNAIDGFDVFVEFKTDSDTASVANVTPYRVDQLTSEEYNGFLDTFVEDIVSWYETCADPSAEFEYAYQKDKAVPASKKSIKGTFTLPTKDVLFKSYVPVGSIDFLVGDDIVSVDFAAVIKADISVASIKETFDPTDSDAAFKTVKVYDRAEITLDKSKTDCFHVPSGKDPIELLHFVSCIKNFRMYGSTYVPTLGDGVATHVAHTIGLILH